MKEQNKEVQQNQNIIAKKKEEQNEVLQDQKLKEDEVRAQREKEQKDREKREQDRKERYDRNVNILNSRRDEIRTYMMDMKKDSARFARKTEYFIGLYEDNAYWDGLPEAYGEEGKNLVAHEKILAGRGLVNASVTQILADDKLIENKDLKDILIKLQGIEISLKEPIASLSGIEEIREHYNEVFKDIRRYINPDVGALLDKKGKVKAQPAGDIMREVFEVIKEEMTNLDTDIKEWKDNGFVPACIKTGMDAVERKHIYGDLEGSGKQLLLKEEMRLTSVKRDNGAEDSDQMKAVKTSFNDFIRYMNDKIYEDPEDMKAQAELMDVTMSYVIKNCERYLRNHKSPRRIDGQERRAAVETILKTVKTAKVGLPISAEKILEWKLKGKTWADAYALTQNTAATLFDQNKVSAVGDLDANKQSELAAGMIQALTVEKKSVVDKKKKKAYEAADKIEDEKKRREYIRKQNKKNATPQMVLFFKTGVWKDNATKDDVKNTVPREDWFIGGFEDWAYDGFFGNEWINEDAYKANVEAMNTQMKKNLEEVEKMDVKKLRHDFLRQLYDSFGNHKSDDEIITVGGFGVGAERIMFAQEFAEKYGDDMEPEYGSTSEYYSIERIVTLRFNEVDRDIRDLYKEKLLKNPFGMTDLGILDLFASKLVENDEDYKRLERLREIGKNNDKVTKELKLFNRGRDIYDCEVVRKLIIGEIKLTDEEYEMLRQNAKDIDEMIEDMTKDKFSYLTSYMVSGGIKEFIGEKALFGKYNQVRDLAEEYIDKIAITNREAARIENDFNMAYTKAMKKSVFSRQLKEAASVFLYNKQRYWKNYNKEDQTDGRQKRMKDRLRLVAMADSVLAEKTKDLSLSREGWNWLMQRMEYILTVKLTEEYTPKEAWFGTSEEEDELRAKLDEWISKSIRARQNYDKTQPPQAYIGRSEFLEEKEPVDDYVRIGKAKHINVIKKDDYTFAGLLRGKYFMESKEIQELIPDIRIRNFLCDNIGSAVTCNPELKQLFPFLKDIESLDQLEGLSISQYKCILNHFKANLLSEDVIQGVKNLLIDSDKKAETKEQFEIRKYVMLEVMKHKTDAEGMRKVIADQTSMLTQQNEIHFKRIMVSLGKNISRAKDRKIHYRYNDIKEDDRSWFKKGTYFAKRMESFDRAHEVWGLLEELGPEAVQQVRSWIRAVMNETSTLKDDKQDERFNALAEMLSFDYASEEDKIANAIKANEGKKKKTKIPEKRTFDYNPSKRLSNDYAHRTKRDLLKDIRDVFTKGRAKDSEDKDSPLLPVKDYILEMSMFDYHDIVLGHGGKGQGLLWADKSTMGNKAYRNEMYKQSKLTIKTVDELEDELKRFTNPQFKEELKDKLAPTYLQMEFYYTRNRYMDNREVESLNKKIDEANLYIDQYNKKKAELEDLQKKSLTEKIDGMYYSNLSMEVEGLEGPARDAQKTRDEAQKELEDILKKKSFANVGKDELDETLRNERRFGIGNIGQISQMLLAHISDDGQVSNQLCDTVALYNSRKRMFEQYGEGELAPFWDELEKIDDVFKDMIDPADTVAEKRIEALYKKLSPFGKALKNMYSYVNDYFIETELRELMDESNKASQKIWKELSTKSEKEQISYWDKRLLDAQNKLMGGAVKGEKSVHDNMAKAHGTLRDYLTEYFLYQRDDFEEKVKEQERIIKTGLFADVESFHQLAEKNEQKKFRMTALAQRRADGIIYNIETYILTDADCIEKAYDVETLKNLYKELSRHYVQNTEEAERSFVKYVLLHEYGIDNSYQLDDDKLREQINALPAVEKKKLENRKDAFTVHVMGPCIREKSVDFNKEIEKRVEYFVTETNIQMENDITFTEEYREGAKRRAKEREKAQIEVAKVKSAGKKAYSEALFGGRLDDLKAFGEKKFALVYGKKGQDYSDMLSRGEEGDKALLDEAKKLFIKGREASEPVYPGILADCMDEYLRLNSGIIEKTDRFLDWVTKNESDVQKEVKRLKAIYRYGKEKANLPDYAVDLYVTYMAKNVKADVDTAESLDAAIKQVSEEIMPYIEKLHELDVLEFTNPSLKLAHRDACEKMRAYLFMEEERGANDLSKYEGMIEAQKSFFIHADAAVSIIEDEVKKNEYTGALEDVYQVRYVNGLYEYFVGDMIKESKALSDDKSRVFDHKAFRTRVADRISNSASREALVVKDNRVSYLDMREKNMYAGGVDQNEFEQYMIRSFGDDFIKDYNTLDDDEKKLFAMSLYVGKKEEHGTLKAIYGMSNTEIEEARASIMAYMRSENVTLKVDYGKAMRALTVKGEGTKVKADKSLFDDALVFVRQVESQRNDLRPKDYMRMADSEQIAQVADRLRVGLGSKYKGFATENYKEMQKVDLDDRHAFLSQLMKYQDADQKRAEEKSTRIQNIMEQVKDLTVSQQSLLIYVLTDRTVLDNAVKKDKDTKLLPFVNTDKRFEIYDRLITADGRLDALREAADPKNIEKAMKQLLSFQLRDDAELSEGELKESDFAPGALSRRDTIDWNLLQRGIDFIKEIENERLKITMVRQAGALLRNEAYGKDSPDVKFYQKHLASANGGSEVTQLENMEKVMLSAYAEDKTDIEKLGIKTDTVIDDLMSGYKALTPEEKNLFFRALENRDILDVSQKNLYLNVLGMGERDYVNPKGRDKLADEFIANNGDVGLSRSAYEKAIESLCSTQINDDQDFTKIKGVDQANKNFTVTNQTFVKDRTTLFGVKTRFDWKLFGRALQFVYRTVNEMKMAAGDEETYKALGDQTFGPMKIDRSYMRQNLHHTGARFLRFLSGYATEKLEKKIKLFDTATDYADFVLSAKQANFLKSKSNQVTGMGAPGKEKKAENDENREKMLDEIDANKEAYDADKELEEKKEKKAAEKEKPADVVKSRKETIEANKKKLEENKKSQKALNEEILAGQELLKKKNLTDEERKQATEKLAADQAKLSAMNIDTAKLESEQKKSKRELAQAERDIRREAAEHNNNIASIMKIVDSVDEQKKLIKDMAKQGKAVLDDYKSLFGIAKDEPLPEEMDELAKSLDGVEVERPVRQESITGNPKLDMLFKIPGVAKDGVEFIQTAVLEDPELATGIAGYVNNYFVKYVFSDGMIDGIDAIDVKLLEWDKSFQEAVVPKPIQDILDGTLEVVTKSGDFLKDMSMYFGEGVQILYNFKDIIGASMNIHKMKKADVEAKEKAGEDAAKIASIDSTVFNKELVEKANANNVALLGDLSYLTKNAEGRKIMSNVGALAERIAGYAEVPGLDMAINAAFHLADYIWKVVTDSKSITDYYAGAGNDTLKKLAGGKNAFEATNVGQQYATKDRPLSYEDGKYKVDKIGKHLLQHGQGFEREEELGDYLKLNMIHSLIFSASKYNPLKQTRIVAECALTVLGLEEYIGKTDAASANEIFKRLKK